MVLSALKRDIERHTPADSKWQRADANPTLTSTVSAAIAAARPEVPADGFSVACRAQVCRLTAATDELFDRLVTSPQVRRIAGKPRWALRSVTFEARPEDSVDGLDYLRSLSVEVERKQVLATCGDPGGGQRLRVPVRLAVTDEAESLDQSGIELMVGTMNGHLDVTACIQRVLRAHLETLSLPPHLSAAVYHTYFFVSAR
jgi:hypothetical protein